MRRSKYTRTALVSEYAERIDRRALKWLEVRNHLKSRGIYALFKKGKLRYVGLAGTSIARRLKAHQRNHLARAWDSFSAYLLTDAGAGFLHDLEATLHRVSDPDKIKQVGRFAAGWDISETLAAWPDSGKLFGAIVAGTIRPETRLRIWFGGRAVPARVTGTGKIRIGTKTFRSPSLAAKYVTRYPQNGWNVWEYERTPLAWRPLKELR